MLTFGVPRTCNETSHVTRRPDAQGMPNDVAFVTGASLAKRLKKVTNATIPGARQAGNSAY